ncbi:MAG TPA: bifunctional UDP-N-acetylglucosamine diphosphorylase/glucosamine-1-phosphate N-acetyltransferase GlmU [Elusimicrobia bacterium]|jgi:bifunctional UDP-N-acetylglucosamine pyrophosphorylase/glucosamine-1-phosphate N-acetyltransferase|nr:bifunctional UDP-N-acetylglucosamine diphosphorylase/glucosamine-1-phosphate N-acetyltransferase GlmU [Elusimicrobiota bacterium]
MKNLTVVILAAGEGTRMKSSLPKVLHPLCGKPLISWVYETVEKLHPGKIYLVVNRNNQKGISAVLPSGNKRIVYIYQNEPLGSGDAVKRCLPYLVNPEVSGHEALRLNSQGDTLILCADTPLITTTTLNNLISQHRQKKNELTILTVKMDNPYGYGRICRSLNGKITKIVEENDANIKEKKIKEINSGVYCVKTKPLCQIIKRLPLNQKKKEYYLTDMVSFFSEENKKTESLMLNCPEEVIGINTRKELAESEKIMRREILDKLMLNGVTIIDPESTYIDADVVIGKDTVILPGTMIRGETEIGENCRLGPQSYIENCVIGNEVEIRASFLYGDKIASGAKIGPFAHLRAGANIGEKARIGNFTEVKKSKIGPGTKVSHLSYIGDAKLGKGINIGAGVITCNYDGISKHQTTIEDEVFIGSNVNLIAPIRIGKKAVIGAGSTISNNVPSKSLAIARSRETIKRNYILKEHLASKKESKNEKSRLRSRASATER